MTDPVKIALIVAIGPTVTAFLALVHQVMLDRKAESRAERADLARGEIKKDIRTIEVATNHIKDELMVATAKASHAEGMAAEQARAKAEKASQDSAVAQDKIKAQKENG